MQKKEFSLSWLRKNISFTANLLTLAPLFSKEFWFFSFKNCVAKIVGTKLENVFANKMTKVRHVYSFIKPNGIWHWQPWWQLDRKQHHSNHVCQKSQMGNFHICAPGKIPMREFQFKKAAGIVPFSAGLPMRYPCPWESRRRKFHSWKGSFHLSLTSFL